MIPMKYSLLTRLINRAKRDTVCILELPRRAKCMTLAKKYQIGSHGEYKRIHFFHVRKAAGTSTNLSFLSTGGEDGKDVYAKMSVGGWNKCYISGDKVFVGWSKQLSERGEYFYSFSHAPAWSLSLPSNTFTFTCFRDPVKRVISHYKMILESLQPEKRNSTNDEERSWLGKTFESFLDSLPKEHLLNQLYMFSENFKIDEALRNVRSCNHIMYVSNYNAGFFALSRMTDISLNPIHYRRTNIDIDISIEEIEKLRLKLRLEYKFLNKLKSL